MTSKTETRSVSLGQVIAIAISIIGSVIVWGIRVENTLSVHAIQIDTNAKDIIYSDSKQETSYIRIMTELKELNKNIVDLKVELQNKVNR